jgi:hypothetical protein
MGDLAYKALDKLSNSSQVWDFTSCRDKSARIPKKRGIYELKGETEMNIKIDALTKRLDALAALVFSKYPMEQANAFNDYRK